MIDIKFKQRDSGVSYVEVNGKLDFRSSVYEGSATLYDKDVINEILDSTFLELKEYFWEVDWRIYLNEDDQLGYKIILEDRYNSYRKCPVVEFEMQIDSEKWSNQWSISDFATELNEYIKSLDDTKIEYWEDEEFLINGFGLRFYVDSFESIIKEEVERHYKNFNNILKMINDRLILESNKYTHTEMYEFPREIKTACEQYLIYFTQFLRDIGIEATADLTNNHNKVLFSVTPKDKQESLERIKDALLIYLNLPAAPEIEMYQSQEIAVQQLQSNIMHLKGQLMLAKSTIQLKDATIEALQLSNYQYKNVLEATNIKKDNEEELLNGVVKVGTYKKFGIGIDFAKIVKMLKRKE